MLDRLTIERTAQLARDGPILIALSGGGDSMALLHLLAEHFGPVRLRAAVVDHALRDGSAQDAARARGFAQALGVPADTLTLAWKHGARRAQQAARAERYRVLCNAAGRLGARVIALGHTADDQAETVLMRAAGGSSWRGLAGMAPIAPAPVWPDGRGVHVARPLLGVRREALRALLRDRAAAWIEDPANANPIYERVRTRARLAELERAGFEVARLMRLAQRLRARADQLDHAAAELIARAAAFEGERIAIDRGAWAAGGGEVRRRALAALITAASGRAREPGLAEIERLEGRLMRTDFRGATLGGAAVEAGRGRLSVARDPGALTGRAGGAGPVAPMELMLGETAVWDGRLELRALAAGVRVETGAAGPILAHEGRRLGLGEAGAIVEACWLLQQRVRRLLLREE